MARKLRAASRWMVLSAVVYSQSLAIATAQSEPRLLPHKDGQAWPEIDVYTKIGSRIDLNLMFQGRLTTPFPNTGIGPAHETLVHAFILAVTLRKVSPSRSRAQYPQHAVHKETVISCGAAHMLLAPRKKILDLLPLQITQFITTWRHILTATPINPNAKCICRYRIGQSIDYRPLEFKSSALIEVPTFVELSQSSRSRLYPCEMAVHKFYLEKRQVWMGRNQ